MAITRTNTQVTWSDVSSLAPTFTLTTGSEVWSDVFTLDPTCTSMSIQVSADNAGTPASGDTAVWRVHWSNGDVLNNTGDDYDTLEHGQLLTVLDTFATSALGEDPARKTVPVDVTSSKFRLTCTCANAATRNITVSARVEEQRAA